MDVMLHFDQNVTDHKTLKPRQNGCHFTEDILMFIFVNHRLFHFDWNITETCLKGPIDNKLTLVQTLDWCRSGSKQLSEPMLA